MKFSKEKNQIIDSPNTPTPPPPPISSKPPTPGQKWISNWNKARLDTGRFDSQLGDGKIDTQRNKMMSIEQTSDRSYFMDKELKYAKTGKWGDDAEGKAFASYSKEDMDEWWGPLKGAVSRPINLQYVDDSFSTKLKNKIGNAFGGSDTVFGVDVHESAHGAGTDERLLPQETMAASIVNKNTQKNKSYPGQGITGYDDYFDDPRELYGRLMQVRAQNNIDPKRVFTKKDVKELKTLGTKGFDSVKFDQYSDQQVLDLFNKVAANKGRDKKNFRNV